MPETLFARSAKRKPKVGTKEQLEKALEGKLATDDLLRVYLLYVIFPLWLLSGVLDYSTHRKIEETSGATESLIHSLMLTLAGVPVMMGLLLEINAMVLAVMGGAFVAHDIASIVDGYYALP